MVRTLLALLVALLFAAPAAAAAGDAARQVAGILDYVGADYAFAVTDGAVVDQAEYAEQLTLLDDAATLAERAGLAPAGAVATGLGDLRALVEAKAPSEVVRDRARRLREVLVAEAGVALTPRAAPDHAHGAELYATQGCADCHGAAGHPDPAVAATMDPAPADFTDPQRVLDMSAWRAFYAITYGVEGTGMRGYAALSEADRWDLAFHVLRLRHAGSDTERGRALVAAAAGRVPPTFAGLATLSDREILARLGEAAPTAADRDAALVYLRAEAPFATEGHGGLVFARAEIESGLAAYNPGAPAAALDHFVSAYLDGIEPHEASLRARDGALVVALERGLTDLRVAAGAGRPVPEVVERAERVLALLDRASAARERRLSGGAVFGAGLLIALREGFEMVLLVGVLLTVVRRRGLAHGAPLVHGGWLAAIPAGILTWFAVGHAIAGLQRELAEGILALVAAAVLLAVTHWTLGQATSSRWVGLLGRLLGAGGSGRWAGAAVFGLSFVAVYREAFELVLFFKALTLDAPGTGGAALAGGVLGMALLAVLATGARWLGGRLSPRPLMLVSGGLLAALSVVLVGKGVHALQEAAVLPLTPVPVPELPFLGVHATAEVLVAQGMLAALLLVSAVGPIRMLRAEELAQAK